MLSCVLLCIAGCRTTLSPINTPFELGRDQTLRELEQDRVDAAILSARALERRFPGADSWGLLAEALWRAGHWRAAEGFMRRAEQAGGPRGTLGLARTAAARGDFERAESLATKAAVDPEVAAESWALRGGIAWRRGDLAGAAAAFLQAGQAPGGADAWAPTAELLDALSRRVDVQTAPWDPYGWMGEASEVALRRGAAGGLWIHVGSGDDVVRLRVALDAPRSFLTPQAVGLLGLRPIGVPGRSVVVAPIVLGGLRSPAVVFGVRNATAGDGALGFDVLSTLRWTLDPRGARLSVARRDDRDGGNSVVRGFRQQSLARVQWVSVRTEVRGTGFGLRLLPRLFSSTITAALDPGVASQLDPLAVADVWKHADVPAPAEAVTARVPVRVGASQVTLDFAIRSLVRMAAGGGTAPVAVLGTDFLDAWRVHWAPEDRQLSLLPSD